MTEHLNKITEAVAKSGFTITDIAKQLDLSRNSFYQKLRGEHEFTLEELKKLAQITGKPLSFFIDYPQAIEVRDVQIPVVSMAKGDDMQGFEFELLEPHEYEYIDFCNCKAVRIRGNSMAPLAYDNQRVIYSEEEVVRDGDLVFISIRKNGQFFKRYHKDPKNEIITLLSINIANHGPINVKSAEIEFMYKVVGVKF